jgi:predicted dehydrogenase
VSAAVLLGLLGCGPSVVRWHVPAALRQRTVRLTAAYDPVAARREAVARLAPGCRPVASADALVEARVVDAVIVAADLGSRAGLAVQALGAKLPVLLEAPPAATIAEAQWVAEAERIVRVPLVVGLNRRWWPPVETIRRALAVGAEPTTLVATSVLLRGPSSGAPPEGAAGLDIELFDDLAVQMDLIRYLVDREILTVTARRDPIEQVEVRLTLMGGGTATCRAGRGPRSEDRLTIAAGGRTYELRGGSDRARPSGGTRAALDLVDTTRRRLTATRDGLSRSYDRQLEGFVEAVRSRTATPPGMADGMAAMLAIDAVRQSLASGAVEIGVPPVPA